jgi:serine/threonine-protein kinase
MTPAAAPGDRPGNVLAALGQEGSRILLRDDSAANAPAPIVKPVPNPPQTGRYRVIGEIARGGMGVVLKGQDIELGRDVAMKVLRDEMVKRPEVVQRFVEEAQIGGQLQHPGIVPVYELGLGEGRAPWFTMKLVKGRTLTALLEEGPGDEARRHRLVSIFASVCQTMAYAHSRGVIHRDLKPSNVMVGAFGEVQVVDWGLAKVLGQGGVVDDAKSVKDSRVSVIATIRSTDTATHSLAGSVLGTPAYMPPEQAQGFVENLDERSDVFSLGAILCEILTGKPPYAGEEQLDQAARADLRDAHARLDASGADAELVAIAKECLRPSPAARPRNAEIVASRVDAHLAGVSQRAHLAAIAAANARARARGLLLVACLLGLVVIAGGGGWWVQHGAIERRGAATRSVGAALEDVHSLHVAAQAAPVGSTSPWEEALAAARSAESLATTLGVESELRDRAGALRRAIETGSARAVAAATRDRTDRAMVERLQDVRGTERDPGAAPKEEFERAFQDYGIDVRALGDEAILARLKESRIRIELATALDYWAALEEPVDARLQRLARAADPDPWRTNLRDATTAAEVRALAESVDVEIAPVESVVELVYALESLGQYDVAAAVGTRVARAHPDDFTTQLVLADVFYRLVVDSSQKGRVEEGLRHATAAVALRPASWRAWNLLGLLHVNAGHYDATADCFRRTVAIRPQDPLSHMNLAYAHVGTASWPEASAECEKALALRPDFTHARFVRGVALTNVRRPDEAAKELRLALDPPQRTRDPLDAGERAEARACLALALLRAGRHDEAMEEADRALEADRGARTTLARDVRGVVLARRGDVDAGRAEIEEAIRIDPRQADSWADLGDLQASERDFAKAAGSYRKWVELEPKSAAARLRLGAALAAGREEEEAVAQLVEAARLDPSDPAPHEQLGLAERARGRLKESREEFRRAQELGAKAPGAAAASAAAAKERLDEAERLLALAPRLEEFLGGATPPADAKQCVDLAKLCAARRLAPAAAGFWERAFALEPALAEEPAAGHRVEAARRAALAARGADGAAALDAESRKRFGAKSLGWLRDDLLLLTEQIETGSADELRSAAAALRGWLHDADFAGVRDEKELARLAPADAAEWKEFWTEVRAQVESSRGR